MQMLVGAIAKELLSEEDVDTLNGILRGHLVGPKSGMGDIITACVWPDQIKCTASRSYCQLSTLPSLNIFNNWHYKSRHGRSANPATLARRSTACPARNCSA